MNYEKNDYFKILKTWCDTLIKLQMKEPQSPAIYGGIFCPACGRIHGRINDCMYPLIYLYKKTGDKILRSGKGRVLLDKTQHPQTGRLLFKRPQLSLVCNHRLF